MTTDVEVHDRRQFVLSIFEGDKFRPPMVFCTVYGGEDHELLLRAQAELPGLLEAMNAGQEALLAWTIHGQVGLMSHFHTRDDLWSLI